MMKFVIFFFTALFVLDVAKGQELKGAKPNIILVFTDDQGSNLSYMGHPIIETPFIDEFARKSVRLNEFHVSPSCAPSRAALMSGRHEFKNGVTHTVHEREYLNIKTTTFPQILQKSGYETGIFGKWHLGDEEAYLPQKRGFDEVLIHGAGGIGQNYDGSCADFPPNIKNYKNCYFNPVLLHNETVVQTTGYCADIFFDSALDWMKRNLEKEKPFFAYISTNTPHSPLIAPQENYDRIKKRHPHLSKVNGRFAMIENIDDNFGKMMHNLEKWGALENTIIVFTTDNGAPYKPGSDAWNYGYKTGKGSGREGGVHVPAFINWKGVLKGNRDINQLTAHIDMFKTFCDLAGAKIPEDIQEIEGRSILPLLQNKKTSWKDRMLFHHRGRWSGNPEDKRDIGSVRTQRWRLIGEKQLYDIKNDPKEGNNVAEDYPEIVDELRKSYLKWWQEARSFMINENRVFIEEAPHKVRYKKQKSSIGIPEWNPTTYSFIKIPKGN